MKNGRKTSIWICLLIFVTFISITFTVFFIWDEKPAKLIREKVYEKMVGFTKIELVIREYADSTKIFYVSANSDSFNYGAEGEVRKLKIHWKKIYEYDSSAIDFVELEGKEREEVKKFLNEMFSKVYNREYLCYSKTNK